MDHSVTRKLLIIYILLLIPITWLAARFGQYQLDGDAVAYMDIADLLRSHHWAGAINGYWNPLYPACLALAKVLSKANNYNELAAYYWMNYAIFLAQIVAIFFFVSALVRLRSKMGTELIKPIMSLNTLRLLGMGLLVIASQRELCMDKVRPDALLLTLLLVALTMLLEALTATSFIPINLLFTRLTGVFFGLAYLAKSVAFLLVLIAIVLMMAFQFWIQHQCIWRIIASGAMAAVGFIIIASPYIAALSLEKHRFDFGDSGALNYAWYSAGTEKMHLEPWMTSSFGAATVHLIHPEKQLLSSPGIYSYRTDIYGTYPTWFDTSFFNDRIIPHLNLPVLTQRDMRDLVLVFRYLFNHPESLILLGLLVIMGARFGYIQHRRQMFWFPMATFGLAMWCIYGVVNIEERYVTVPFIVMALTAFAMLYLPSNEEDTGDEEGLLWIQKTVTAMVILLAFFALGESLRVALEARRNAEVAGLTHTWESPHVIDSARALSVLGVKPGDEIACLGDGACMYHYWARLAGVRILTEVYMPKQSHLIQQFAAITNRQQV